MAESFVLSAFFDVKGQVRDGSTMYSVTGIGASAFANCTGMTSVTIPASIASIGESAFSGCINLMQVFCLGATPPGLTKAFARTRAPYRASLFEGVDMEKCALFVPDGSEEAYKAAEGWNEFKLILPMSAQGISGITMGDGPQDVYNLQGQKVSTSATSFDGLPSGVYIVSGRKVVRK